MFIFQSAKKCKITSFYMTALHIDLNEAVKCVDNVFATHITSLLIAPSYTRTKYKVATIVGLTYADSSTNFMEVGGIKTWEELVIDDYAKDGGEEPFTKMHCVLITNP